MQNGVIIRSVDCTTFPEYVEVSGDAVIGQEVQPGTFHHQLMNALRRALINHSDYFFHCGRRETDNAVVLVDETYSGIWAWVAFPHNGVWDMCDPGSRRAEKADFQTRAMCVAMRILIQEHPEYFDKLFQ